jgi:hypothetical protein
MVLLVNLSQFDSLLNEFGTSRNRFAEFLIDGGTGLNKGILIGVVDFNRAFDFL